MRIIHIFSIFYILDLASFALQENKMLLEKMCAKSVQSALSDLLTASATHGTFSHQSTKRGLILIGLELNIPMPGSRLNIADHIH